MEINNISIKNDGYVYCKSNFYSAQDFLNSDFIYNFSKGINKLCGEIDSGTWAISYLISMYKYRPKDFVLFEPPKITINDNSFNLNDFFEYTCYMDKIYPLFANNSTVEKLIVKGLKHSKSEYSTEEIKRLFKLDNERFKRSLNGTGNEVFKAMAAIGFAYGKEVFCFPWFSNMRFKNYHKNITDLLDVLSNLNKIVILPLGVDKLENH